jgi:molecular chaperone GrpE
MMSSADGPARTQDEQRGAAQVLDERSAVAGADMAPADTPAPHGPSVVELEDRWRRAVAELDNVRKRFERQLAEAVRAERARTASSFLPVLDNLELALQHAGADPAAIVTGVQAVHQQGLAVLAGLGYQRIVPVGERFDPARHEAARVASAEGVEAGTVVEVHRAGYVDPAGVLVRPAVVTVARADDQRSEPNGHRPGGQDEDGNQR